MSERAHCLPDVLHKKVNKQLNQSVCLLLIGSNYLRFSISGKLDAQFCHSFFFHWRRWRGTKNFVTLAQLRAWINCAEGGVIWGAGKLVNRKRLAHGVKNISFHLAQSNPTQPIWAKQHSQTKYQKKKGLRQLHVFTSTFIDGFFLLRLDDGKMAFPLK